MVVNVRLEQDLFPFEKPIDNRVIHFEKHLGSAIDNFRGRLQIIFVRVFQQDVNFFRFQRLFNRRSQRGGYGVQFQTGIDQLAKLPQDDLPVRGGVEEQVPHDTQNSQSQWFQQQEYRCHQQDDDGRVGHMIPHI